MSENADILKWIATRHQCSDVLKSMFVIDVLHLQILFLWHLAANINIKYKRKKSVLQYIFISTADMLTYHHEIQVNANGL